MSSGNAAERLDRLEIPLRGDNVNCIRMEDMNWPDIREAMEKGFTTA